VAPLDIVLRKKIIKLLGTVQCNGVEAFTTSFLVGVGAEMSLMTSWQVSWSTDLAKLKYYQETSTVAKQQLQEFNSDFGVSTNALTEEWKQLIEDVAQMPTAAFALAPGMCRHTTRPMIGSSFLTFLGPSPPKGYNIPELQGQRLVLDCNTLAQIYLNNITMWNDSRIKAINTAKVAGLLPAQPIVVITLSESSAITQLFTYMLNATVPSFARQVGAGSLVYFPVMGAFNRSLNASTGEELVSLLRSTSYSLATWMHQPLLQSRSLGVAGMINSANKTVRASISSVTSSINDWIESGTALAYNSLILGIYSINYILFLSINCKELSQLFLLYQIR
jgi:hypothetical protein